MNLVEKAERRRQRLAKKKRAPGQAKDLTGTPKGPIVRVGNLRIRRKAHEAENL